MFKNKRYITKGISQKVDPLLQIFMWHCIASLPEPKDYLQVFTVIADGKKLKIKHSQEDPEYEKECLLDAPFYVGKIFVIDDKTHSTMLLAEEY